MVKLAKSSLKMNIFEETHPARRDEGLVLPAELSMTEPSYQHGSKRTTGCSCNKHMEGG